MATPFRQRSKFKPESGAWARGKRGEGGGGGSAHHLRFWIGGTSFQSEDRSERAWGWRADDMCCALVHSAEEKRTAFVHFPARAPFEHTENREYLHQDSKNLHLKSDMSSLKTEHLFT